jgi:hypothetical protein
MILLDTDTIPCVDCGTPVDANIHQEELGFCLDCSNDYWAHTGKYDPKYGRLGRQSW